MRALLVILSLAACSGYDDRDGVFTYVDVTSPTPFDRLVVYWAQWTPPYGAPITPLVQMTGEAPPEDYRVNDGTRLELKYDPKRRTEISSELDNWDLTSNTYWVGVVAFDGETMVGADAVVTDYEVDGVALEAHVELDLRHFAEVWGTGEPQCARFVHGTSFYWVRGDDVDCDDIPNRIDCQPEVTCIEELQDKCVCGCSGCVP